MDEKFSLDAFPPISKAAWLDKIEKDLKGRSLEELQWHLGEEITLEPFYHAEDMEKWQEPLQSPSSSGDWEIGEDLEIDSLPESNTHLLEVLNRGVNAPRIILNKSLSINDFERLFKDVNIEAISIHFAGDWVSSAPKAVVKVFHQFLQSHYENPNIIRGSLNFDPYESGVIEKTEESRLLSEFHSQQLASFRAFTINGMPYFSGSEGAVKELTSILTHGNTLIKDLITSGISIENIQSSLQFSVAIGKSYFVEIAKIRALKILWANILKGYGVKNDFSCFIDAHFAPSESGENPYTNMIRSSTQAMSAVLGGANRLTVLPADATTDQQISFAKRTAGNVQHILKMESYLHRVIDPAAGSYYIEKLTDKLAEAVWGIFRKTDFR